MTRRITIRELLRRDIYCGRGKGYNWNPLNCRPGENGWLGNPIIVNSNCSLCGSLHQKGEALICYEDYLISRLKEEEFLKEFKKLRGKRLAWFCPLNSPCHIDIIIKHIDRFFLSEDNHEYRV